MEWDLGLTGFPAEECSRPACPSQSHHWSILPDPALAELHTPTQVRLRVTAATQVQQDITRLLLCAYVHSLCAWLCVYHEYPGLSEQVLATEWHQLQAIMPMHHCHLCRWHVATPDEVLRVI